MFLVHQSIDQSIRPSIHSLQSEVTGRDGVAGKIGQRNPYRLQRAALVMSVFANAISILVVIGALSVYSSCSRSSKSLANAFPGDQPDVAYATGRCDDQSFCSVLRRHVGHRSLALCREPRMRGFFQVVVTLISLPRLRPSHSSWYWPALLLIVLLELKYLTT